jgi:hypothetical protein
MWRHRPAEALRWKRPTSSIEAAILPVQGMTLPRYVILTPRTRTLRTPRPSREDLAMAPGLLRQA